MLANNSQKKYGEIFAAAKQAEMVARIEERNLQRAERDAAQKRKRECRTEDLRMAREQH